MVVTPITARAIWPVLSIIAFLKGSPERRERSIFSLITIASSTKIPNARISPTILNWFRLQPNILNRNTPIDNDKGIEIITTAVERNPSGNKVMETSKMAIMKSCSN